MENTEIKKIEKVKPDVDGFLNPFIKGVSYDDFLEAKGKKTVESYCKDKLTENQINFINQELNLLKK